MIRTPYEAGGFAFPDEQMMEKAVREGEGIQYIKNSADRNNPKMIYELYCQMVRQRLFETPVGYVYLYELQEYLKTNPSISNQDILAIPVAAEQAAASKRKRETGEPAGPVKTKTKTVYKTKERNVDYKPWLKASLSVSVVLLLIVIGMFVVTATSGNINILNYENALIEKYENWETQLKEKEEKLREREDALRQREKEAEQNAS